VVDGLRLRNVNVLTAFEDGSHRLEDPELLDRAGELERVLFSQDDDLLAEAASRQRNEVYFAGVIYAHQRSLTVRDCIEELELIAQALDPEDLKGRVMFPPPEMRV
jgi:hypothetical protein